jgi:putative salt-induced outer membrane protein YdiY
MYRSTALFVAINLILWATPALSQVNTESMAAQASESGWAYELNASITLKRGNTESLAVGAGSKLRFLTLHHDADLPKGGEPWFRDRFLAVGNFTYESSSGDRIDNEAFAHLRWTRMWHPRVGHELYSQVEYAEFRRLNRRLLFGGGVRTVIANREIVQFWVGTGYFVELEDYDLSELRPIDFESQQTNHRWSSYVALKLNDKEENVQWVNTLYIQPRFDDFADYQLLYESSLSVVILGPMTLGVELEVQHDSRPVPVIEKTDVTLTNFLKLTL